MSFDAQKFMEQSLPEGSTSVVPCPEGEWEAVISKEPTFEEFTSNKTNETYTKMTVFLEITDPEVTEVTQRDPTVVRFQPFVDLNEEGKLDMNRGKNISINRLRAAVDLNKPGFRFPDLVGKSLKVRVTHRADPNDDTKVYDEVRSVAHV